MTKKITSFTSHQTAEGMRISYTYSKIDEEGNVTESNTRASIIVLDDFIMDYINSISDFLSTKIPD